MSAPTQQYPPWLTPIPTVVQDANGALTTSTTVLFLPLTYYGPSIPLGPDWTYGGLTPPASTPTISIPFTTSTTTAIPSQTSSTTSAISPSSSSAITSSSITESISSSSTIPITSTPVPTQTPAPTSSASRLTRGQLVGVIVASILGFIFLLVLILAIYLFCKGKNRRRSRAAGPPIDDDYAVVPPGGRLPGEGSPRHSGEEADPFLQPSGRGGNGGGVTERGNGAGTAYTEMGARPPPRNVPRVPPPPNTIPSLSSSNSSSTNSGYGEPLAQPTLGIRPIREEHEQEMSGGRILTPEEMQRLEQETVLPPDSDQEPGEQYSGAYAYDDAPLLPPPRLVDPASRSAPSFTLPRPPFSKRPSQASHRSSLPLDADENATLLTAKRVRVEDLGPRSSPGSSPVTEEANTSKPSTSSFLGSLGALASRLSWRQNGSPRTPQQQPLLESTPLTEQDLEQGRALPRLPQMRETASSRGGLSVGLGPDGTRPISSVSGRSGNSGGTVYHDALSSLPATPTLTPLPRAATPSDTSAPLPPVPVSDAQLRPAVSSQLAQTQTTAPLEYEDQPKATDSPGTSYTRTLAPSFDILDMPAPSAISSFGSTSSASLKASTTSDATVVNNTASVRTYPFSPGLDLIPTPQAWIEVLNGETPSPGSYGGDQENGAGINIAIDVLEEEPPTAGESWKSMAAATSGSGGDGVERLARRTTFGLPQYVHQPGFTSEQGSLHSMRSHVSPASPPRSTGSAAASSRKDLSYSSNSSRPSAHSASGSSGAMSFAQSLARSGSITSDGRKRGYAHGPISPALSAFGNHLRGGSGSGSGSGSGGAGGSDFAVSREGSGGTGESGGVLQSPSTAYLAPARVVSTGSSVVSGSSLSPLSMPWAAGLDESWSPSS